MSIKVENWNAERSAKIQETLQELPFKSVILIGEIAYQKWGGQGIGAYSEWDGLGRTFKYPEILDFACTDGVRVIYNPEVHGS